MVVVRVVKREVTVAVKAGTWFALVLAAGLLLSGCSDSKPASVSAAPAPAAPTASSPEPEGYVASGPIIVENQVDVVAQREGIVARIEVEAGTQVHKGKLLAQFDDRQLTADRDAAQARALSIEADLKNWEALLKVAQADSERAEKMWAAKLITKEQYDHDRYKAVAGQYEVDRERENLRSARATLQSLQLELDKTRIVAPFDGVVARRYVRVGQRVASSDRLFWVTATSPMRIRLAVPERFLGSLKPGSELAVTCSSSAGEHKAKVVMVAPVVDPSSGTVDVVAELVGPAGGLRPGMTANVRLPNPR